MMKHKFCQICGYTADILPLEIDHIDGDATNNDLNNLQVLCTLCNKGKAYGQKLEKKFNDGVLTVA